MERRLKSMLTMHYRRWIATVAGVGIAITLLLWFYPSKPQPDKRALSIAEDEVYEAVVSDRVTPAHGQPGISQLVFDNMVLTYLRSGASIKSCEGIARKNLALENATLPYNSLADKLYRIFARSAYDESLRADTIRDFLEKACTIGPLSQTFHTDLPRTFIAAESLHFSDLKIEKDASPSFEQLFPGASGVISLSHVGFDPSLDEAIVATAFVCGGLCGIGSRYVLRTKRRKMGSGE